MQLSTKFKIGDKVRLIESRRYSNINAGTTGTIVDVDLTDPTAKWIGVRWNLKEPSVKFHSCDGNCKEGYGYYVIEKYVSTLRNQEEFHDEWR